LKLEEEKDNQGVNDISQYLRNVYLMSSSDEEPVYDDGRSKNQTLVESNGTIMLLNSKIQMLQTDLDRVYRQVRGQQEKRDYLKNELAVLKKESMNWDMVKKEQIEFLKKIVKDRNEEVKALWIMIQKLKSARIEKELKNKISDLKVSIPNVKPSDDIFVSNATIDWKMKIRQDLVRSRKLSDLRKRDKLLNEKFNDRLRLGNTRKVNNSLKFVQNKRKFCDRSKYVSELQHGVRFGMKHTGSVKSVDGGKVDKAILIRKGF